MNTNAKEDFGHSTKVKTSARKDVVYSSNNKQTVGKKTVTADLKDTAPPDSTETRAEENLHHNRSPQKL